MGAPTFQAAAHELRRLGLPDVDPPLWTFRDDEPMKRHPDYRAAKSGDVEAAARSGRMRADERFLKEIEARFGDLVRTELGVDPSALTADEAQYLVGFRDDDELANRIASARRERKARLRARGLLREDIVEPPSTPHE